METAAKSRSERSTWGGRRLGAGRRPRDADKWIRARGLSPATAAELLERADERRIWYRLLNSDDDAIVLRAITYLTDRRDGRAAQQINVTSQHLTINADSVEKARAIVTEIRSRIAPSLGATTSASDKPSIATASLASGENDRRLA